MEIRFKKLVPEAKISKAHGDDAGWDLTATSIEYDEHGCVVYGTGIALEIPKGHVGLLFPRSSNAKYDLFLSNSVGVIDSGYRGEVMFKFKPQWRFRPPEKPLNGLYDVGDRIGQLIVMPYPEVTFVESDELSETERGTGGYGSTGSK